ncbi:hypothetical protein GF389_01040 [Candidatus Dojkabacteria bacterium]|nr:hypothetical protein [Candidatus Dojkabacteria bacterium]
MTLTNVMIETMSVVEMIGLTEIVGTNLTIGVPHMIEMTDVFGLIENVEVVDRVWRIECVANRRPQKAEKHFSGFRFALPYSSQPEFLCFEFAQERSQPAPLIVQIAISPILLLD